MFFPANDYYSSEPLPIDWMSMIGGTAVKNIESEDNSLYMEKQLEGSFKNK